MTVYFACSMTRNSDSLVELTELVHKGEKRGLFPDRMPAHIQQVVRDKNLRFMKNRDVYDANYFSFVRRLANKNAVRCLSYALQTAHSRANTGVV